MTRFLAPAIFAFLAACGPSDQDRLDDRAASVPQAGDPALAGSEPEAPPLPPPPVSPPPLIGKDLALAEWRKAEYRGSCAPLALRYDGGAGGEPRPATFSGGWAVAFDRPGRRSAYGFAGTGRLPEDELPFVDQVAALDRQWPLTRRWEAGANLPAGSAAGYGLEGARPYADGSDGAGDQSLAYLRIPGQDCLYNVWSKLGRAHLEHLLGELVIVEP